MLSMFSFFSVVGWLGTDRLARPTPDRKRVDRNCWHGHCAPLCALSLQPFMGRACKTISAMLRDYSVSDTPNTKDLDDNFLVQVAGFKCPCATSVFLGTCYCSVASLHNQPLTLSISRAEGALRAWVHGLADVCHEVRAPLCVWGV